MKDIVILGAGGLAERFFFELRELNKKAPVSNILGFADDSPDMNGKTINGVSVLGGSDWLKRAAASRFALSLPWAARALRRMLYERIRTNANTFFSRILSPTTSYAPKTLRSARAA